MFQQKNAIFIFFSFVSFFVQTHFYSLLLQFKKVLFVDTKGIQTMDVCGAVVLYIILNIPLSLSLPAFYSILLGP